MTPRTGNGAQDGPPADAEVAAAITAAAGLRRRLRRLGTTENPALEHELRKLQEQLADRSEQAAGRSPGRHRYQVSTESGDGDASEADIKPDPAAARTPAEYVTVLWQYQAWSGDPTWRQIAARAGHMAVHSTVYSGMHSCTLPTLDVVKAIILGCGGGQDDLDAFMSAWQRISAAVAAKEAEGPGLLPAPVPELQGAAST